MKENVKQLAQEIGVSEIEKILEELKREDNKQVARDWFHNYLMGVSIYKNEKHPESLFLKDENGRVVMEQDYKNDSFWISYNKIWLTLKSKYDLNGQEIKNLIKNVVSETFKIKVNTPEGIWMNEAFICY